MSADDAARARHLAQRLARMVRIPTITPDGGPLGPQDARVFAELRALLAELYPRTWAAAEVDVVGRAGLLLRVPGGASAARGATALGPVVLMAHQDVVPAPREGWADAGWSHDPFVGAITGGTGDTDDLTVHGRGTLDDKGALLVTLEAVEDLLAAGWRPDADLWILLGADEERDGPSAAAAVDLLRSRGVRPALVIDEGGAVVTGAFPGLRRPMAAVGVAEKGVVTLEVVVDGDPRRAAHASTPPRRGVVAALGRALEALERRPHPAVVDDVTVAMFDAVAPHVPAPLGALLRRAGTLRTALARVLPLLGGEIAAMVRTTTTPTVLRGSAAPNVIAARASAVVNMRVATSSSVAEATAHVERVVRRAVGRGGPGGHGGPTASVRVLEASEPTPASPLDDERWALVSDAVTHAYPDAVVAPYTMLAVSDARHVARIADAIYRFSPLRMTAAQRASIHGVDEQVAASSLVAGVRFYTRLLQG
ncbi:M20/M25/M40 family metallo-hydrolase [Litorihabitans aurantiacus]|uniref:Peptidase M20 n=1 Tax=Litorihabitans aurantiacus TaxID=1930061 RepID=A0AA38CU84_9MICO|nr:M20/M25/M40 family metallo-hydrolase [Litorihabitans aurantiacus]GMA32529.1 peptidase M20 [Litorihabitans aurantiacus]